MDEQEDFKKRTWYVLQSVVLTGAVISILVLASSYVLFIIAGILLAILALRLMSFWQTRFNLPRGLSFIVTWLFILGLPILLVGISFPNLQAQFGDLGDRISIESISDSWVGDVPGFSVVTESLSPSDVVEWFQNSALSGRAGGFVFSAINAVVSIFLLLFIGIYGSFDPGIYRRQVANWMPRHWYVMSTQRYPVIKETLGRWIFGRVSSMLVVAGLTYFGLLFIGIDLAFLLAVLAGLLSFVPNIGPIVSVLPAIAVAITQDPSLVLWVIGLYLLVQVVESYFITPFIEQWAVDIPPASLLIAQAIMGVLFGIIGIVLAGPLMALLIALTSDPHEYS